MSKDLENPLIRDFFEEKRGTVFCLSERSWRARDARAVQEILSRFPPTDFNVKAIYAKARHQGYFDVKELRNFCTLLRQAKGTEPSATELLTHMESQNKEQKDNLLVPVKGPIIIVGRPESYVSYHMREPTEFRELVRVSGFPSRFSFLSDEPVNPGDKTTGNPPYRTIQDQRTSEEYHHHQDSDESPREITDYAVIYSTRLRESFHTHGRLVTIVGGTSTIGTLGAVKLLMDSDELLKACPELRKRVRWPVELLLEVHVKSEGNAMEDIWDVSIKDVKVKLPVSMGFTRRQKMSDDTQKSPGEILEELSKEQRTIDFTKPRHWWHPPGLPLAAQLVGNPEGRVKKFVDELRSLAQDTHPVLIEGESGVGKEIAAHLFFLFNAFWRSTTKKGWKQTGEAYNGRSEGLPKEFTGLPEVGDMLFVAVNCGDLPGDLIKSELSGHVKGGFTDAQQNRAGAFLSAGSGTLFLDEIHTLSVTQQASFLRALEVREVKPVGWDDTVPYGCNVVAASNADLQRLSRRGHFRGDLLNRFRRVTIPPLNERLEDVLVHVVQELFVRSHEEGGGGSFVVKMTKRFIRLLLAQDFRRRNFRWLASLVTAADGKRANRAGIPLLRSEFLPADLQRQLPLPDKKKGGETDKEKGGETDEEKDHAITFQAEFDASWGFDFRSLPKMFMKPATPEEEPVETLTSETVDRLVTQVIQWREGIKHLLRVRNPQTDLTKCENCTDCRSLQEYNRQVPISWYLNELATTQRWKDCELKEMLDGAKKEAWSNLFLELYHNLLDPQSLAKLFGINYPNPFKKCIEKAHLVVSQRKEASQGCSELQKNR